MEFPAYNFVAFILCDLLVYSHDLLIYSYYILLLLRKNLGTCIKDRAKHLCPSFFRKNSKQLFLKIWNQSVFSSRVL